MKTHRRVSSRDGISSSSSPIWERDSCLDSYSLVTYFTSSLLLSYSILTVEKKRKRSKASDVIEFVAKSLDTCRDVLQSADEALRGKSDEESAN